MPRAPAPRGPLEPETEPPDGRRVVLVVVATLVALVLGAAALYVVRSSDGGLTSGNSGDLARVPAAPADLAPQTSWVDARILASGDVRVQHWIRSDRDLFVVGLSVPPNASAAAGSPPVRVRGVRVFADGREVSGRERLRGGRGMYAFAGSNEVFIRYLLEGAVERSGSVAGRALARIVALDIDLTRPLRATTYAVSGGEVLNLACSPPHAGAVPFSCGSPAGTGWQVRLARGDRNAVVSAQLDLP